MKESFLAHYAVLLITRLGYAGVGIGLFLNSVGVPLPSEILLPSVGVVVKQGDMTAVAAIIVAIIAQFVGALVSRYIGAKGGRPLIHRYGKYVLLSDRELDLAHKWFGRYGHYAAVGGYCLPVIRGYVGYAAGLAEMPAKTFAISALIGITVWTAVMVRLGYVLSDNLTAIETVMRPFSYAIAALLVVAIGFAIWSRTKGRHV